MLKNITICGTRFRLNLKLQNLSMISIAVKLWDSKDIKNRIKNDFSKLGYAYPDRNWCEISKLVVQHANSMELPPSLSLLLKKTILLIGQKIYDWIYYVTKILELDFIFTEKIYFSFGIIDEIKIFDLYWRDLMASYNFTYQKYFLSSTPLFSLACIYGCEGFVKERKNEMLAEISKSYSQMKAGDEICYIMSFFICNTSTISSLAKDSPQQMIVGCLMAGFSKAARFYWEKLDEIEKVSNLITFAKTCFSLIHNDEPGFLMEKCCESLLFFVNQMEEEEWYLFFTDFADEIIKLFLRAWSYQELIIDLLKYDWNIVASSKLLNIIRFSISFSAAMNRLECPLVNELVFQILQKAWGNIPVVEKTNFLGENLRLPDMLEWQNVCSPFLEELTISSFFLTLNPGILNLLFNDPSITEIPIFNEMEFFMESGITDIAGNKMDFFIKKGFVELVKFGKIDFLNEIIETIFNFIPEPKEFLKKQFSNGLLLQDLMENDESFGFLNQFLDWLAESEAERARLKNNINTISVCRSLTEPRIQSFKFELADKFLKWKLGTDAEIKSFKEEMKSYNFVIVEFSAYVRIKSGDLSWLKANDLLAMHPDEYSYDNNADGFTFLKFEDATELNRGVVLGIKCGVDPDIFGPDGCQAEKRLVKYVGAKVGDYIVFTVRDIWNARRSDSEPGRYSTFFLELDEVVELSNSFIKFYYETDEEVLKFKQTKLVVLVTEDVIEFLLYTFNRRSQYPKHFLDNFCKYCMISSEKIEEIKIRQRSNIETFLDTYLIDQRRFQLTDFYLNWLFGEVKKMEVSKKFLNSSNKGALLCVSYLKQCGEVNPVGNDREMISRWLSMVDDVEKLKNDVFAITDNTPEWFSAFLDRLTGGSDGIIITGCRCRQ